MAAISFSFDFSQAEGTSDTSSSTSRDLYSKSLWFLVGANATLWATYYHLDSELTELKHRYEVVRRQFFSLDTPIEILLQVGELRESFVDPTTKSVSVSHVGEMMKAMAEGYKALVAQHEIFMGEFQGKRDDPSFLPKMRSLPDAIKEIELLRPEVEGATSASLELISRIKKVTAPDLIDGIHNELFNLSNDTLAPALNKLREKIEVIQNNQVSILCRRFFHNVLPSAFYIFFT